MSKATKCIIIYSIVMVILFVAFCYLMTTINPAPLKHESSDDGLNDTVVKFEDIIFDEGLLPPAVNPMFGLEKADIEPTDEHVTKPYRRMPIIIRNSSATFNFTTQRVRPPTWLGTTTSMRSTNQSINNITSVVSVTRTPSTANDLNTEMETIQSYETTIIPSNVSTQVSEDTESNTITPMRGRRRSIIDFEGHTNEKLDSVVLYIIDKSGQLKFEVKLASNGLSKNENIKHETESTFSIGIVKNNGEPFVISNLAKNSTIKVLPNNTAIIDEFEDVNLDKEYELQIYTVDVIIKETTTNIDNLYMTPVYNTKEQVTDYGDVFLKLQNEMNTTKAIPIYTDVYALKVLFDNETKSITNTITGDKFDQTTIKDNIIDDILTESFDNNTEKYDINNNSVTSEKSYNFQDFVTVL